MTACNVKRFRDCMLVLLMLGIVGGMAGCSKKALQASSPDGLVGEETADELGAGNVTQLDDEYVSDALIMVEEEDSNLAAESRDVRNAEIVIEREHTVFKDIYFDFDRQTPKEGMLRQLKTQAEWLRNHSDAEVLVAGHCDTRGSREYNIVLGEKRAHWIKRFFMKSGVNGERVSIISYGKERPNCLDGTEECHSKNRRAQIVLQ